LNSVGDVQHRIASSKQSFELGVWQKKLLLILVDVSLLLFFIFYYHLIQNTKLSFFDFLNRYTANILYGVGILWLLSSTFKLYDLEYINKTRKVLPLSFFIGIICTTFYIFGPILDPEFPIQRGPILIFIFGFTTALIIWRVIYASLIHTNVFVKNFILLTSGSTDIKLLHAIKKSIEGNEYDHGLRILRMYRIPEGEEQIQHLSRTIERMASKKLIDNIIILNKDQESLSTSLNTVFVSVMKHGVQVRTYFELYEEIKEAIPIQFAGNQFYTILPISKYNSNYIYILWYKLLDVITSVIGLFLMILLTPLILLLNLFFNRGPLFYQQYRVGKGGEEIEITKFRSMIVEAEKHGAKMSVKGDLRITSFGHILRKTRIDELPQFWSVIKGDMSFIGPRPERKIFIDQLVKSIPLYNSRHLIKPGITGWAQVKYDYGENIEDSLKKLEYDLYYIKNRSVTLDIRIIFKTIHTIIFYKGQ
jgi:lipopolysaccharide/colanic/teichoic acid biosynthesis glycosyltransferase